MTAIWVKHSHSQTSYYPLPSVLFRDNLQHWSGDFARLLKVQFTSNEGMSNDAPIHECESEIDHYTGHYVPYSLRRVCGFFNVPQIFYYMCKGLWDGAYGLSSLSEKTRKSNRLQMLLQRQHFFVSYLKTLSVVPAGVWTYGLPLSKPGGGWVVSVPISSRKMTRQFCFSAGG